MRVYTLFAWVLIPMMALAQPKASSSASDIEFKYEKIFSKNSAIPHAPLLRELTYYNDNFSSIPNTDYITFVNFSLDSDIPRMYVIDMRDGESHVYLVSHGSGSDPHKTGKARRFSNEEGSKMSSLGIYLTENIFNGKHENSLVLKGLESTNNHAEERGILLHAGEYVDGERGKLGTSWGCFVVEEQYLNKIEDEIKHGSLLMAWIDPSLLDD